jgi:hypothetical protein
LFIFSEQNEIHRIVPLKSTIGNSSCNSSFFINHIPSKQRIFGKNLDLQKFTWELTAGGNGSRWQKLRQNEIQKILTTWCDSIDA